MRSHPTRRIVLLIVLTNVCIGLQLTPRPPNVEFTSLFVFLVGAIFGVVFGATLAVLIMFINGFFSPWGFAGLMLPFQVVGMVIVGVGGGVYKRAKADSYNATSCLETAVLGAFLTLVYDVITNFGVAMSYMLAGTPIYLAFISAVIAGALFSLVHIVSNTIVFGMIFVPLTNTLQKLLGGEQKWKKEFLPT
ncbi:MAG TPA: hypothetical protein VMT26_06665 [Candidatus Bathyarchaeia archaeon]|nr:hypothetical protein [Candidatus Bathyarchaeia archaeon]